MDAKQPRAAVIGAGLAGSEAAAVIARFGHPVDLYEMKPAKFSAAHSRAGFAELVCSNSLGADAPDSAPGLLKEEMKALGSVILAAAYRSRVAAGKALGVDREQFSDLVTAYIESTERIRIRREECERIPDDAVVVVATGPLTSEALGQDLLRYIGGDTLYFYDSISPIVTAESIDLSKTFFGSRYQPKGDDYLNCPFDREGYETFVEAVRTAERVPVRSFEAMKCFEACLPIEILAERGPKTLAFGPMRPVGLIDPRTGSRPYAVVQLRRENEPTTLYNLVGFQTRMKWGEQQRVFRMIPGLERAEFARLGSMHRNTYVDSPRLLNPDLALREHSRILLSGQITGVEGYVESAAMGQWAGISAVARLRGLDRIPAPPPQTAFGALIRAITTPPLHGAFAPMNMNFGLLPPAPPEMRSKDERREYLVRAAQKAAREWRGRLAEALGKEKVERDVRPEILHAASL